MFGIPHPTNEVNIRAKINYKFGFLNFSLTSYPYNPTLIQFDKFYLEVGGQAI